MNTAQSAIRPELPVSMLPPVPRAAAVLNINRASWKEEDREEQVFEGIVGRSVALQRALQEVQVVAPTDCGVLILGETGTGKELIARAIHNLSARRDRPSRARPA